MRAWLEYVSEQAIVLIDAIALLVILISTAEAAVEAVRSVFRQESRHLLRLNWLRHARWPVAALTFQLAADIIETPIGRSWEAIGRVGAIAVIRTFLNFFLDRDLGEVRTRDRGSAASAAPDH